MHLLIGLAGIVLILAIAFALSSNRRAIRPRVVGAAFLLQAGIALLVLYFMPHRSPALQQVATQKLSYKQAEQAIAAKQKSDKSISDFKKGCETKRYTHGKKV